MNIGKPTKNNKIAASVDPDYETPDSFQEEEEDFVSSKRFSQPTLYNTDWTAETAVNQIIRGIIDLNPRFQRRSAWGNADKSKFIESLAMGIPIPQVILAEHPRKSSHYVVIDGKQRLLSLLQFIAPEEKMPRGFSKFRLSGLKYRHDLNGKSFEDIQSNDDGITIENAVIRTVVVRSVKEDDYLYEIFLRLNTQSMKLSPQELRQALVPGSFTDFVDDTATNSPSIKKTLNIKEPDRRMRDNELVLRYFAFATRLPHYAGNFRNFLDETTRYYNANWSEMSGYLYEQSLELEHAIAATFEIFGRHSFQVYEDRAYTRRFNRAVFDIMVFFFSQPEVRDAALRRFREVETAFQVECFSNSEFRNSFSSNTKEVSNVYVRLSTWGNVLQHCIGVNVPRVSIDDRRLSVVY